MPGEWFPRPATKGWSREPFALGMGQWAHSLGICGYTYRHFQKRPPLVNIFRMSVFPCTFRWFERLLSKSD
ncbi:hypothetical protein JTE90_000851 [Oedothorax gibbosus]|uniref:Uncharacterized protein n=1 Tax=Oedothorax gibbosus TaxID=931172 RepID=A0AAV6VVD2_9ARAC|nr:hypothetical protein JTE90_000851 [Oedothorax gibbosus]